MRRRRTPAVAQRAAHIPPIELGWCDDSDPTLYAREARPYRSRCAHCLQRFVTDGPRDMPCPCCGDRLIVTVECDCGREVRVNPLENDW